MNARSTRLALVLLLAAFVASAAGCAAKSSGTAGTAGTATAAATSAPPAEATATAEIVPSSGPITKPLVGSAVRTAVLDAARRGLGTTSKFVVYQLHVQGGVAVGDVRPEAGGARSFFACTGGPSTWKMVWTAPFGTSEANAAAARTAIPGASPELVDSIAWKLRLPAGDAAMLASFKRYAQTSVAHFAGAYSGGFTYTYRIAKTPAGTWYGNCLAQPNKPGLEAIGIYGKHSGGKWSGRVAEFGVDNDDALFFPASVLSQLQL